MENLKIQWNNFRGIKMPTELEIAPLTLIIGRNNVGKSSLYAPLLMLRQTLDATQPDTALLGRGEWADVGTFKDYVSEHDVSRSLSLSFSLRRPGNMRVTAGTPARIETTFASPDGLAAKVIKQKIYNAEGIAQVTRSRKVNESNFDFTSPLLPKAESVGRPLKEVTQLRKSLREEQPMGFLFAGTGGLFVPRTFREDADRWEKIRHWFNQTSNLHDFQSIARGLARRTLLGIHYVGPLRHRSLRTYRLTAEPPASVGPDGQYAAELLFRRRNEAILGEVNKWLSHLGYGVLHFEAMGDDYFQVNLEAHGSKFAVNLAHTGTGVSQILPILTQGLLAARGETFITQQPEIHLNPAQQTLAMDFLIERSRAGSRVVIETHSEHMLLRLRRRIAEGEIDGDAVRVYFVEASGSGESVIRQVDIDDIGNLDPSSWPEGFFGELMDDAFALAIAQSRASGGSSPIPSAEDVS